jgi:hypothetical protein
VKSLLTGDVSVQNATAASRSQSCRHGFGQRVEREERGLDDFAAIGRGHSPWQPGDHVDAVCGAPESVSPVIANSSPARPVRYPVSSRSSRRAAAIGVLAR